jgi:hypothetical protein
MLNHTRLNRFLTKAEYEGLICSGKDRKGKPTYALLAERIGEVKPSAGEESLAKLCTKFFRSHFPATLTDFTWWSGLSKGEAGKAVCTIKSDLTEDNLDGRKYYIHKDCRIIDHAEENVTLLPVFDEYIISYKDRSDVIEPEHFSKVFTRFGTFFPVILYNGREVGNWRKTVKNKQPDIEFTFFDGIMPPERLLESAEQHYLRWDASKTAACVNTPVR